MIKKIALIIFLAFLFSFWAGFSPKNAQAMLLREKSLRESFFTELIDEISLVPGSAGLTQTGYFNYNQPLGIEVVFRNPSQKTAKGKLRLVLPKRAWQSVIEKEFLIEPESPANFVLFSFEKVENLKGEWFWLMIDNEGDVPLIVGYYNQNVYHYGDLSLGKNWQEGTLQFQVHYQINPIQEIASNLKGYWQKGWLFFSVWLSIIIVMTILVFILAKNYRTETKKKS